MSGVITAAVATSVSAYMAYEGNRTAQAAQRNQENRIKQEQNKINADIAAEQKRKAEQDILMSRNALRLRTNGVAIAGTGTSPMGLNQPISANLDKLGL